MIWRCWTIQSHCSSPHLKGGRDVVHIFVGMVLILMWCKMSIYQWEAHAEWDSGRCAGVWANWTNPRNWANSAAIQQLLSGNCPTEGAEQWMDLSGSVKLIPIKMGSATRWIKNKGPSQIWDKLTWLLFINTKMSLTYDYWLELFLGHDNVT